jgi:hypothetical protein
MVTAPPEPAEEGYTGQMYGYEPPKEPQGTWREIMNYSWAAMTVIYPVVGMVLGVMLLVVLFFVCLSIHPLLTLIPVGLFVLFGFGFVLLDRHNQQQLDTQSRGGSGPPSG